MVHFSKVMSYQVTQPRVFLVGEIIRTGHMLENRMWHSLGVRTNLPCSFMIKYSGAICITSSQNGNISE